MNKEIASNLFWNDVMSLSHRGCLLQIAKRVYCLIFQLVQVPQKSFQLARILNVVRLISQESKAFIWESKSSEHEWFNWLWKVPVLCFLAVFIHYVTYYCKVNNWLDFSSLLTFNHIFFNKFVIFGVPMWKENHHSFKKKISSLLVIQN